MPIDQAAITRCRDAITQVQKVSNANLSLQTQYDNALQIWAQADAAYTASLNNYRNKDGNWAVYPKTNPGEFWTGCDPNGDGNGVCRANANTGKPEYWNATDSNCSSCGAASRACTGAFGTQKKWKRKCTFDWGRSEQDYTSSSPPDTRPSKPNPPVMVPPGSIVCNECTNTVNITGSVVSNTNFNQLSQCIANLEKQAAGSAIDDAANTINVKAAEAAQKKKYLIIGIIAVFSLIMLGGIAYFALN